MEKYIKIKLEGDAYPSDFSGGLTLTWSQTAHIFMETAENTIEDERGYMSDINGKVRDDARLTEYSVTFVNNSDKTAVLELLSSFAF